MIYIVIMDNFSVQVQFGHAGASAHGEKETAVAKNKVRVQHSIAWHGMAWHGMAWHGMAWHGMAWHGMA